MPIALFKRSIFLSFSISIILLSLVLNPVSFLQPAFAQTAVQIQSAAASNGSVQCDTPAQKIACQTALTDLENQITDVTSQLTTTQNQASSISRDISILDLQVKQAQLKIKAHKLAIDNLSKNIAVTNNTINALTDQIGHDQGSLGRIINQANQLENFSLAEAFLSGGDLSKFFIDLDSFASINQSLRSILGDIKSSKDQNVQTKQQLSDKRVQEQAIEVNVETEKQNITAAQNQKKKLLSLNKTQQKNYQSTIADKQSQASKIRTALFSLRDAPSIQFGDAVVYAKAASAATGVRPAFLLAVIQQESNLGSNVGACYLTNATDGSGIKISTGVAVKNIMKPSRDVQPFLAITGALGRDPYKTRVSCPFSVGYGGAMGPAQFIASTWALNISRLKTSLGISSEPDPWNPKDAFMASALYLSDLGAGNGGYTAERNAACKYYSGSSCNSSNKFYGDQVIAKATALQGNIDILAGNQ